MATWRDVIESDSRWSCEASDCLEWLRALPADSVHCWITSPPYYGLRDYGHAGQMGNEPTPGEYVERMVEVFSEARRALHPSGCLWLNLGDSYANDAKGPNGMPGPGLDGAANQAAVRKPWRSDGVKKKDLLMIPSRVAMALQADGWYLRSACPWVKRNPMPESVTDRPGNGCEWVFLLAKRPDYFFDMEAVRRQAQERIETDTPIRRQVESGTAGRREGGGNDGLGNNGGTRNLRTSDLWFDSVGMLLADTDEPDLLGFDVTPERYKGAHFAVMPTRLVAPMVLAGTSARGVCPHCGEPWTRAVAKERKATRPGTDSKVNKQDAATGRHDQVGFNARWKAEQVGNRDPERHVTTTRTVGWEQGCECPHAEPVPAVVGDMFTGSGTVAQVAVDLGRRFVGAELNPEYHRLIAKRLGKVTPSLLNC